MQEFELVLKEWPFSLKDKEGKVQNYVIREMDGEKRDAYLNQSNPAVVKDEQGNAVSVRNFTGINSTLLALCTFDAGNVLVPFAALQSWPARILRELFKQAVEINGLGEPEKEREKSKNDLPASGSPGTDSPPDSTEASKSA